MTGELRERSAPFMYSVLLHGLLVLGFLLATKFSFHATTQSLQPLPIDAVVIDSQILQAAQHAEADRRQAAEQARAAAKAKADADTQAADAARVSAEKQRVEQAQAAANAKAAQAKAAIDAQALADAKAQAQAKVLADAKASADAKAAADAKASAAAKAAADAKATADAKAASDAAAKTQREAELRRQLADEEHANAVATGPLRDRYAASLRNAIQRAWIKPPSATVGVDCTVQVTQVPGGEVTAAHVTECNGDAAVRQSIENAVYRASPLPEPPDPALFQRNFAFRFRPDE